MRLRRKKKNRKVGLDSHCRECYGVSGSSWNQASFDLRELELNLWEIFQA